MLNRLRFNWHYRRKHFVRALAYSGLGTRTGFSGKTLWALYQVGMLATVAQTTKAPSGLRGRFAQTVALAACGQSEEARRMLARMRRHAGWRGCLAPLSKALAPYLPEEALQLAEKSGKAGPGLRLALLLANGHQADAKALLDSQSKLAAKTEPELHLLHTNALSGSPNEQLQRLNAYLATYNIAPLHLLDASLPPSPFNVGAAPRAQTATGPLVTVLMTTYRTGNLAIAAIQSILQQSYTNLELIIIDDGSDDSTVALITAQTALDSRVRIVQLPDNMGTYAAKLIGLSQARGEFVTCQDSDDWAHPEKIERQLAPLLQDEQLVCTVSNWVRMRGDGSFYSRMVYPLTRLNPSSPLFRRQRVVETTGAWDCVRTGADSEFLARLKLVFGRNAVKKINQPLVLGSHRPDSLMTASATGYSTSGVSRPRLAYWESWTRWHIHCLAAGKVPMMSLNQQGPAMSRPFVAPEALQICTQSIPAELYQKIIANYPPRHYR